MSKYLPANAAAMASCASRFFGSASSFLINAFVSLYTSKLFSSVSSMRTGARPGSSPFLILGRCSHKRTTEYVKVWLRLNWVFWYALGGGSCLFLSRYYDH